MSKKAHARGWTREDWYREGEQQLHFFQRERRVVFVLGRKVVSTAPAVGGAPPGPRDRSQIMLPQLTTAGTYVLGRTERYVTRTWPMSRIPWGAELQAQGPWLLYRTSTKGAWTRVDAQIPGFTLEYAIELYEQLYGKSRVHDRNGDGIPDRWVFNDFGPWSVRWFVDKNRNRKMDPGEHPSGEMFHTTPQDEAATALGDDVHLEFSHGCIHLRPVDRDRLFSLGALKPGLLFVVHGQEELLPDFLGEQLRK